MSVTLVEALDAIPSNLADCSAEDFKTLSGAVNGLDAEAETDKEVVIRLTKVVDRLIQNWVKRGGKLPNKKKSKKTEEDAEEGKDGEEAAEPVEEEKEEEEEAAPRDPVAYHKGLVSLTATVQAFAGLSPAQVKKMHASLRLLVTPVDELKQKKKDAKKGPAPKDEVVLSSEVLDAIRIIQKFQIGEKGKKGKGSKDAQKEEEPKKKRTRNRNRKPRGEQDAEAKEEAGEEAKQGEENTPEADNNESAAVEAKVETVEAVEAPAAEAVAA